MDVADLYLVLLVAVSATLTLTLALVARQARDLDQASADLAAARRERDRQRYRAARYQQLYQQAAGRIRHCESQHLGDLDAAVEATRPPGAAPLDALVRPVGIQPFPINRKHRSN